MSPAVLIAAGSAAGSAAATEPKEEAKLPQIRLGPHQISRLICGANPFNASSHLSVFVNYEMKRYYTPERVLQTLRRCCEAGINCWASGRQNYDFNRRLLDEGIKMHYLGAGDPSKYAQLPVIAKVGCIGVAHHGEVTDRLFKQGRKLDQIGDYLKRVHDAGSVRDPRGHTWYTFLLPFVEQRPLYEQVSPRGQEIPAAAPSGEDPLRTPLSMYRCPSDPGDAVNRHYGNYPTANYVASRTMFNAPGNSMRWPVCVRMSQIADGLSNTFLVSERGFFDRSTAAIWSGWITTAGSFNFSSTRPINTPYLAADGDPTGPVDVSPGGDPWYSRFTVTSRHPGGANFAFCDGSVHFISEGIETNPKLTKMGQGDFKTSSEGEYGNYAYQNLINYDDGNPIPGGVF